MSGHVLVRHDMKKIMEYKTINDVLPFELERYCLSNNAQPLEIRSEFQQDLVNITTSVLNGIDPNDILLKTNIRDLLNKISSNNYNEYIDKLKNIKYENANHFTMLVNEIIDRSMNDPVACSGFTPTKSDTYISDINADIAKDFCQLSVKQVDNGEDVAFKKILTSMCQKQFVEFIDINKKLDLNNKHRVDNFKGFMNLLGLLANRGILSSKIVVICLHEIKSLIYKSDWSCQESENLFTGYTRLVSQLIYNFEATKCKNADLLEAVIKVTDTIFAENEANKKLRMMPMIAYQSMMEKLRLLKHKYTK
jgi:hypothetical protein